MNMTQDNDKPVREVSRQDALRALSEMREYLDQEVEPELDIIEKWANAFDALLSGGGDAVRALVDEWADDDTPILRGDAAAELRAALKLAATPAPAAINPPLADSKTIGAPAVREAVGAIFVLRGKRHFSQATTPERVAQFQRDNPAGWEFDGWLYTAPTFKNHIEAIRAKLVEMAENWRAGRYLDGTKTLWDAGAHASDGMEACADNVDEFLSTAITTPPAEAREPVGDAELRQQRDAAEQRAATLSRMLEERTFPSVEVTDAMVERGLRWYWPNDMKYADNQRDFMRRFLEAALAQPRDTPRDSGDAADAARYRFLRDPKNSIVYAMDWVNWNEVPHSGRSHFRYEEPEQLDSAIDAQIAAMQSPTGEPT